MLNLLESAFLYLLERSAGAAFVIAAVLLCRLALRDAPKTFRVLLWAVVALRLLCPVTPESRLSLIPAPRPVTFAVAETEPVAEPPVYDAPVTYDAAPRPVADPRPVRPAATRATPNPVRLLSVVWACGLCALALYSLYSYLKLKRVVSASLPLRDGVWLCDDIASPFVLGLVRPRIYVPSGLPDAQLPCVLAHERAHIRRGDPVWKLFAWATLCLYWFHPLVWLSYALFCRDVELACDERAIRDVGPSGRAAYSETLLHCGLRRRTLQVTPLAFDGAGVKERVRAVLRYRKPTFWATCAAATLCVAAAVCLLTRPASTEALEPDDGETTPPVEASEPDDGETTPPVEASEPDDGETAPPARDRVEVVTAADALTVWVESNADALWNEPRKALQCPQFPGVTFLCEPENISATDADGVTTELIYGMPVWNAYAYDLNGDGFPELCATVSFGSGIIDERVVVYDYKNRRKAELASRMAYDYTLSTENGVLTVSQWEYAKRSAAPMMTGALRLSDAGRLYMVPSHPDWIGSAAHSVWQLSPELDAAVSQAVIAHERERYAPGELDAESHVTLSAKWGDNGECTLYLVSLFQSYNLINGRIDDAGGRNGALVLTFRTRNNGSLALTDYWEPRDGADYWPDVRGKFPSSLADALLSSQTQVVQRTQDCYRQAVEHWNLDTDAVLDDLFTEVMSGPLTSSNPGDYLNAHPIAAREIVYYGDYAKRYIDARIGGDTGLKGALMRELRAQLDALERTDAGAGGLPDLGKLWYAALNHAGEHTGPTPGTYALADPEKLSELLDLLTQAEPAPGAGGCPFEDALALNDERGNVVQLALATDSCPYFRYGGLYYRYGARDADNSVLYGLFGE